MGGAVGPETQEGHVESDLDAESGASPLLRASSEPLVTLMPAAPMYSWTERAHMLVGRLLQLGLSASGEAQSVSGAHRPSPTFQCPLCCEDVSEENRVVLAQCCSVHHGCCRTCMRRYISGLVADGRVESIRCPVKETCGSVVQSFELLHLTDDETFSKYERFRRMHVDPSLRQCPKCDVLCQPSRDVEGGIILEMQCRQCLAEFCYHHSNAHAGQSCEAYRRRLDEDEQHALALDTETKPCPGCGILTDKISGCNHMTCPRCGTEWCWICGDGIEDVGTHFSADNPKGSKQFQDTEDPLTYVHYVLCCLCFSFFLGAVLIPLGVYLSQQKFKNLLFWVLLACCCCRCRGSSDNRRG